MAAQIFKSCGFSHSISHFIFLNEFGRGRNACVRPIPDIKFILLLSVRTKCYVENVCIINILCCVYDRSCFVRFLSQRVSIIMQNGQRSVVMYLLYGGSDLLAASEAVSRGDRAAVQKQGDR